MLLPIFKWPGGKKREIRLFEDFFPEFVSKENYTYVEPFVGGGALYWYLNNLSGKNIINDFDRDVANFYKEFQLGSPDFIGQIRDFGNINNHDELEKLFYNYRDKDRDGGLKKLSNTEKAIRFFVVSQLAYSGMRRFNGSGEFNVPFGHYRNFKTDVVDSAGHKLLLNQTIIHQGDFEPVMRANDTGNTFQFLDPPYVRNFKEYSADCSFGEKEHRRLAKTIKSMKKASIMMIIDKSPFTERLYKSMIRSSYTLKYSFKIKNRFSAAAEHLVICNY